MSSSRLARRARPATGAGSRLECRHPFLDHDGPIAFAHRGGAAEAPENTMVAFEHAIALGYRYLETDARVTRDRVVVALHDGWLDRLTDHKGAVSEIDFADLQVADAGYGFSPDGGVSHPFRGRGVRVPRLEDILMRWPSVRLNIDLKTDECALPLAELLDMMCAWERVCIGSFSNHRLRRIRALSRGRACTSMGRRAVAVARLAAGYGVLARQGADCVQIPPRRGLVPLATKRFIGAAHRTGMPIHVWTVNDETVMHQLLDLGVDGIMSDRTTLLRDVFAARGLQM